MPLFRTKKIEPESAARLRECLTALAAHSGAHVLRVEVGLGASTAATPADEATSLVMIVTHSLGPKHEAKIGPALARAFFGAFRGLGDVSVDVEEGDDG